VTDQLALPLAFDAPAAPPEDPMLVPLHYLWHPEAVRTLQTLMGPHDDRQPYTVERVTPEGTTIAERFGRPCEAEWAADWLHGTRTPADVAAGVEYRVGIAPEAEVAS
jgi:hypothetical protein